MEEQIAMLLQQLTLEEKVSLVSGADNWHTRAFEHLNLPAIRMTDGPHGVRRPYPDESNSWPATSFPTAMAMAATWNPDLVRRVGAALAEETKSKGCDILLGPAVNIHRTPLNGRNFEYFSEDPYLAGRLATAYIQGLQSGGVGASLKHYAANNSEFERFTISSQVDERTLREIYLPAFEMAVKEAQPWTVMCSYNKINGTWASENRYLLHDILKQEWGFEGFVVSDWGAVHHRINCANAGLDLEMPGLGELPVKILLNAVKQGLVAEETIDESVRRILRVVLMAKRSGEPRSLQAGASNTPEQRALALEAAGEAIVLLKNEGNLLPLDSQKLKTIAVFGPNAATARIQGGGSAHVNPYYAVSPLEGIRSRAGEQVQILYSLGAKNTIYPPALDEQYVQTPDGSKRGFVVSYFAGEDFQGEPVLKQHAPALTFSTNDLPDELAKQPLCVRWEGCFTAPASGDFRFSLNSNGQCRMLVNGQEVVDHWTDPDLHAFSSVWPFQSKTGNFRMQEGQLYTIVVEYKAMLERKRLNAGYELPVPADEMERVAQMAAQADVAIVCVGTSHEHESEGFDRADWHLPGEQARLIETVTRANPRTVVVLTHGAQLDLAGWVKKVPALVEGLFTGQESGNALAAVLFGDMNPSGKLPDSYPVHYEDNPSFTNYPGELGEVRYGEGLFVGYRYFDARNIEPLFPFGFGLSYTSFAYSNLRVSASTFRAEDGLEVQVDVRNTGPRAGKEVVQLYVRDLAARLVRPPKELKAFQKVALAAGEATTVTLRLDRRAFAFYDPSVPGWVAEAGEFDILVGSSSREIRASARVTLQSEQPAQPRFHAETNMRVLLDDPQARAVLERHMPEFINEPNLEREAHWFTLRRLSLTFMELLGPETVDRIADDLAQLG